MAAWGYAAASRRSARDRYAHVATGGGGAGAVAQRSHFLSTGVAQALGAPEITTAIDYSVGRTATGAASAAAARRTRSGGRAASALGGRAAGAVRGSEETPTTSRLRRFISMPRRSSSRSNSGPDAGAGAGAGAGARARESERVGAGEGSRARASPSPSPVSSARRFDLGRLDSSSSSSLLNASGLSSYESLHPIDASDARGSVSRSGSALGGRLSLTGDPLEAAIDQALAAPPAARERKTSHSSADDDDDDHGDGNNGVYGDVGDVSWLETPFLARTGRATRLVGLLNLGNTCFMNSVLQCLLHTPPLSAYFMAGPGPRRRSYAADLNRTTKMRGRLAEAYAALVAETERARVGYVSPSGFKRSVGQFAPRFMGYQQQDAQEFLRFLLDGLHEDLNRVRRKPPPERVDDDAEDRLPAAKRGELAWDRCLRRGSSAVYDLFLGQICSVVTCARCGHESATFDPFLDLSVPIPARCQRSSGRSAYASLTSSLRYTSAYSAAPSSAASCSLEECFGEFADTETLSGSEPYRCSRCRRNVSASKRLAIDRFPRVLVIHVKRFIYNTYSRQKLSTQLRIPLRSLVLDRYASPTAPRGSRTYDLYAVSNHWGSLYGGHYTAHCFSPATGEWAEFNDGRAAPSEPDTRGSAAAYVLFYARRDA